MVTTFDHVLLCWFRNGQASLRTSDEKTASRENPNRWAHVPSNRAHGAAVQNRSCSIKWAAKQENVQPLETCFFLTSTSIELTKSYGTWRARLNCRGRSARLAPLAGPANGTFLVRTQSSHGIDSGSAHGRQERGHDASGRDDSQCG
jgi:hypothetical protein